MKSRQQQASRAALDLIKRFEGYRRVAARLPDGRWTIGFGHAKTARQGAEVSEDDAEALLIYDLMEVSAAIHEGVYTPLTQNQFDALAAFVFNVGIENFRRSVVLRRLNEGALLQAAYALELWRRAEFEGESIVVDALVRRRAAEKALFLTPPGGFVPAPTQILRPAFDPDTSDQAPAEAVEIEPSLEGEEATAKRIGGPDPLELAAEEPATPTQAAAAALAARLDAILREDETDARAQDEAFLALEELLPADDDDAELAVPPAPLAEEFAPALGGLDPEAWRVAAELEPEPEQPGLFSPIPGAAEPLPGDETGEFGVARYSARDGRFTGAPAMLGLGAFGLALFLAGLFWMFNARKADTDGLFTGPLIAGLAVGLGGIACMALAIYFLLDRLGGREES